MTSKTVPSKGEDLPFDTVMAADFERLQQLAVAINDGVRVDKPAVNELSKNLKRLKLIMVLCNGHVAELRSRK